MKKLTKFLGLLFLSMTILFSCGEDAKSDKESDKDKKKDKYKKEIKDPCDILDYTIEIFEDLERLSDEYDDIDDLEDDKKDKKKVNAYFDDLEDAWKYAFKKFNENEMLEILERECRNQVEMEESVDEIKDFYEERFEDLTAFLEKRKAEFYQDLFQNYEEEEGYYYGEDAAAEEATEEEYYYGEDAAVEEATEEEYYYGEDEDAESYDGDTDDTEEYMQYYHIVDPDGWTNMRYNPNGEIIRKVYSNEEFLVILENEGWSYVMFDDGSSGYIHSSRIHETY